VERCEKPATDQGLPPGRRQSSGYLPGASGASRTRTRNAYFLRGWGSVREPPTPLAKVKGVSALGVASLLALRLSSALMSDDGTKYWLEEALRLAIHAPESPQSRGLIVAILYARVAYRRHELAGCEIEPRQVFELSDFTRHQAEFLRKATVLGDRVP